MKNPCGHSPWCEDDRCCCDKWEEETKKHKSKKYLVCPGIVVSKHDGESHHITAAELIRLYRVDPKLCKIVLRREDVFGIDWSEYIVLRPRTDGNYETPEN